MEGCRSKLLAPELGQAVTVLTTDQSENGQKRKLVSSCVVSAVGFSSRVRLPLWV